jgi:hypothetical protein
LLTSLSSLTLGAFAIGTEGFMIAGLLPALARDLNVGLPAAGNLVTAFSLAYAIGAPVMAVLTAGLERRRLLAVAMGGFTLGNLLARWRGDRGHFQSHGDTGGGLPVNQEVCALTGNRIAVRFAYEFHDDSGT